MHDAQSGDLQASGKRPRIVKVPSVVSFCSSERREDPTTPSDSGQFSLSLLSPERLKELWNEIVQKPRVLSLTTKRLKNIRARLREHPDESWWTAVLSKVRASAFLRGAGPHGWRADFDWLIGNDTNAVKVLEGKYDSRLRDRAQAIAEEVGGGPEEVR